MEHGKQLNPEHSLRTPKGIKGTRQKVIVTHNPSEIDQAQELLVKFSNLGSDDVIIPGTVNLSFNIELTSTVDTNRTLVSNIGRAIVKKLAVKFEGNEIMSVDNFDVFACYRDLWKTKSEKRNAICQGIISNDGCTPNCIKLRINAGDKNASNAQDKAIADAYRNKLIIPLDFEMLDSAAPYYQAGLGNRLCYELTFNDYNRVTKSGVSSPKVPDAKYKITDISLEYEIVTQPHLARSIRSEYQHMVLLYDRILSHRITNQDVLSEDLENDPFLNSALQRFTCELYYRFGSFLAPLSIGIITSRHYLSQCNKNGEGTSEMGDNKNGADEKTAK